MQVSALLAAIAPTTRKNSNLDHGTSSCVCIRIDVSTCLVVVLRTPRHNMHNRRATRTIQETPPLHSNAAYNMASLPASHSRSTLPLPVPPPASLSLAGVHLRKPLPFLFSPPPPPGSHHTSLERNWLLLVGSAAPIGDALPCVAD